MTAFGSVAERARQHLRKGNRVAIQGRMKTSKFTDRTGAERTGFEILADEIALWKSLPAGPAGKAPTRSTPMMEDDLPF